MKPRAHGAVKTPVIFDQSLIHEIDRLNPFPTRTEFLARTCVVISPDAANQAGSLVIVAPVSKGRRGKGFLSRGSPSQRRRRTLL